jgi:hypothetical protein
MEEQQMQGSSGQKNPHKAVMARLQKALSDPETRKSFSSDPGATVKGYDKLPQQVRDTIESLEPEELDLLAQTHQKLADAGLYEDVEDMDGGGRVSFF